jgi:hypothetical protein
MALALVAREQCLHAQNETVLAREVAASGEPFALPGVGRLDAGALLRRCKTGVDDVVLGAEFGRDLQRRFEHLHMARQPPGFVHEVDRQRTVHGKGDAAPGAGGLQPGELRLPNLSADDEVHVVGRQLDRFDAERLDHVELGAEIGEVVGPLVRGNAGAEYAVRLHGRRPSRSRRPSSGIGPA